MRGSSVRIRRVAQLKKRDEFGRMREWYFVNSEGRYSSGQRGLTVRYCSSERGLSDELSGITVKATF